MTGSGDLLAVWRVRRKVLGAVGLVTFLLVTPAVVVAGPLHVSDASPTGNELGGAIASLAQGLGPADGKRILCTASSDSQASCGAPETPAVSDPGSTGNGTWIPLTVGRYAGGLAYDPMIGRTVLFGGANASGPLHDTWTYRNGTWTQLLITPAPSAREWPSMTYDPADGCVLLFGGFNGAVYLNDTWEFVNGAWRNLTTSVAPSPREGAGLTYDAPDGYVVLFGGNNGGTYLNDTWKFLGGTWTHRVTSKAPSVRSQAAMTYDSADRNVLLFGGYSGSSYLGDTWSYSAGVWTLRHPATSPPGRSEAGIATDLFDHAVFLFGGTDGSPLSDTWTYVSGAWSPVANGPSARAGALVTFDDASPDRYVVLVGGLGSAYDSDTWSFRGGIWTNVSGGSPPAARSGASLVWDPSVSGAILFGGYSGSSYLNDTWMYAQGAWTRVSTPAAPSPRAGASMVFVGPKSSTLLGIIYLFGGSNGVSYLNDTWTYGNGNWTPLTTVHAPSPRAGAATIFNPYVGSVVLFGGLGPSGYLGDTYWLDPTNNTWTRTVPTTPPSPRAYSGVTYDPLDESLLLFGGVGPTGYLSDSWELRGGNATTYTKWTNATHPLAPGPRTNTTLSWDTVARYAVLVGGQNSSGYLGDVWLFEQGNWTSVVTSPMPSNRTDSVGVFDSTDFTWVLFGGLGPTGPLNDTWEWVVFAIRAFASLDPIDATATELFSPSVFAGVPPYTFSWKFGDGGSSTQKSPSYQYSTPSPPSGYTASLTVTDHATNNSTTTLVVVVNSALQITASAFPTPVDAGLPVDFTGTFVNGTGPYSYAWNFGDGTPSENTSLSPSHTYSLSGSYTATFWVNDSGGLSLNKSVKIDVSASPVSMATATPSTTDAGIAVVLSGVVSGGTSPYSYAWVFGDGSKGATASLSHAYALPGSYLAQLWVNDSYGESAYSNATVTVNPALVKPTIAVVPKSETVETGGTVELWGNFTGGTSPYTITWRFGDGSTGSGAHPSHVYQTVGSYVVNLWVNDSVGGSVHNTTPVTVTQGPTVSATATPTTTDVGVPVQFQATVSGGVTPYTVTWKFGDGTSGSGTSVTHSYATAGNVVATVWANDSGGGASETTVAVVVNPAVGVSASVTPTTTDVGLAVTFSGSGTGGTSPLTFAWNFGDGAKSATASPSHAYTQPGTFVATLWVNDSLGQSAEKNLTILVDAVPSISSFTVSPSSVTQGGSVVFTVVASGGTGVLGYAYSGLPSGCTTTNSSTLTCAPSETGTFSVQVTVTDALRAATHASATLQVAAKSSSSTGFLGLSGNTGVYLLIGAAVVVVAGLAVALLLRRRGGASKDTSAGSQGAETESSAEASSPARPPP